MSRPSDARTHGDGRADSNPCADPVEAHAPPPHARANEPEVMEHALTMVRAHGVGDAILELSDCNRGVTDMRAVQLLEQIEAAEARSRHRNSTR